MATDTLTLFSLISGDLLSTAFSVKVQSSASVDELKDAIAAKNPAAFGHIDAKDLVLWRATVPTDEDAGDERIIKLDDLDDKTKLANPRTGLSKIFPETPDDSTYIMVERPKPQSTPQTQESEAKMAALQDEIVELKSTSIALAIVDKRGGNNKQICRYATDTKTATLVELRHILGEHFDEFETDPFVQIYWYQPGCATPVWLANDDVLRSCLDIAKDNGYKTFNISLASPAKNFSVYVWKDAQGQYGVGEAELMPEFDIEPKSLQDNEKTTLEHVVQDCIFKQKAYVLGPGSSERTKSSVVDTFMVGAMQSYDSQMYLARERPMSGMRGHGPVDYAVVDRIHNSQVLGVTEVKKEDFLKGMAQNMAQLDVAVQQKKRKRMDEVDEGSGERPPVRFKSYGIVTDSFMWILLECTLDEQEVLTYRRKNIPGLRLDLIKEEADLKADCGKVFSYLLALFDLMKDEIVNRSTYGSPAPGSVPNKRIATGRVAREGDGVGTSRTHAATQEPVTHQA